jgi:TrmH family RNA methyltransferase
MEKITSRKNPTLVHLKKLGADKDYRDVNKEYLCDGVKLLEEAVLSGVEIPAVVTSVPIPFPLHVETRVSYTSRDIIDSISPLKNAQAVLFSCKMKELNNNLSELKSGIHILLDKVQDPGNVGTIIRSACAFGVNSVLLTDGCADPYNPKTIRAAMGATFKQKVSYIDKNGLVSLAESGHKIIGAHVGEDSENIKNVDMSNSIIVIGNEGQGISEEILALCSKKIKIPIVPNCESLNAAVAASIIIWEAKAIIR